ncbi:MULTISPECIES: class IV adenylate cyclase [unclassified Pseudodesulfovibrio]|uniref:class IV adenylate cyclase n=1 Tax=unclassified Pseudodesulfovibrio TaxID=2661612 RepID=UPI000FEB9360|nr:MULTISPECIES: class IV adenylate cyclase [unclassified Pseudodesulfovibrio]MCJ2163670.1 class IV adenylate cyclase [Pseudodesulfovibrio sp. S3-i]RWU06071.1 CYTH domain-containing protein [Pseudodesulfovibrio sp. S3]
MTLECELKYLNADLKDLSHRLQRAGGESSGRYLEVNMVFDRPDRSLKQDGILLRLREKQGRGVLTVKRPPDVVQSSILKVFEEIETAVGDVSVMKTALEAVGFMQVFAYEKVREKWRFMECNVCLDQLPFGDFVEIEGTDDSVPACAKLLGLDVAATTKETYHGLNIEYRQAQGLEPDENFVFDAAVRISILDELGKE